MSKVVDIKKKRKTTPWNKVKKEYLEGVTPKELALKYGISDKTIREKASKEGWVGEKATICNNLQQNVQERIKGLTNLALDTLVEVINSPETENNTKVSACKAILDISGLKSSKQEITQKEIKIEVANSDDKELLEGL